MNSQIDKIHISKATPIVDSELVNDAEIHIKKTIPEFIDLKQAGEYYKNDALDIFEILKTHLPQGTRHQLLICLLKDAENLYHGI